MAQESFFDHCRCPSTIQSRVLKNIRNSKTSALAGFYIQKQFYLLKGIMGCRVVVAGLGAGEKKVESLSTFSGAVFFVDKRKWQSQKIAYCGGQVE